MGALFFFLLVAAVSEIDSGRGIPSTNKNTYAL